MEADDTRTNHLQKKVNEWNWNDKKKPKCKPWYTLQVQKQRKSSISFVWLTSHDLSVFTCAWLRFVSINDQEGGSAFHDSWIMKQPSTLRSWLKKWTQTVSLSSCSLAWKTTSFLQSILHLHANAILTSSPHHCPFRSFSFKSFVGSNLPETRTRIISWHEQQKEKSSNTLYGCLYPSFMFWRKVLENAICILQQNELVKHEHPTVNCFLFFLYFSQNKSHNSFSNDSTNKIKQKQNSQLCGQFVIMFLCQSKRRCWIFSIQSQNEKKNTSFVSFLWFFVDWMKSCLATTTFSNVVPKKKNTSPQKIHLTRPQNKSFFDKLKTKMRRIFVRSFCWQFLAALQSSCTCSFGTVHLNTWRNPPSFLCASSPVTVHTLSVVGSLILRQARRKHNSEQLRIIQLVVVLVHKLLEPLNFFVNTPFFHCDSDIDQHKLVFWSHRKRLASGWVDLPSSFSSVK